MCNIAREIFIKNNTVNIWLILINFSAAPELLSTAIDDDEDATLIDEQEVDNLILMSTSSNEFKLQAIGYRSGSVLRMIGSFVKCEIC